MTSIGTTTAEAFAKNFGNLDKDALLGMLSPTFVYTFAPGSIPLPPMNSEAWSAHLDMIRSVMKAYPINIETLVDGGDKVAMYVTGQAGFKDELMDDGLSREEWTFKGEFMIILTIANSGKLDGIFEFMDSKGMEKLFTLVGRASKNLQDMTSN